MKKVEGNVTESRVVNDRGQPVEHETTQGGSGKFAMHSDGSEMERVGFQSGRTIELRRFEFARVKLGISVSYQGVQRDSVLAACENFILEMVKREEAAVGKSKYVPDVPADVIGLLDNCVRRTISLSYGLTLKAAKDYESHQVDVIEELPISDGASIVEAFEALSEELAEKTNEQYLRIRSIGKSVGL